MSYIKKSLRPGENVIMEGMLHWLYLVPRGLVAVLVLLVAVCTMDSSTLFLAFIVDCIIMWKPVITYFTTEIGITDKRIIGKRGLINTLSLDAPLSKVNNVYVKSGLLGKIFNYGDIKITTSSGEYLFNGIANAEELKNELMEQCSR